MLNTRRVLRGPIGCVKRNASATRCVAVTRTVAQCPTDCACGGYRNIVVRALAARLPDLLGCAERVKPQGRVAARRRRLATKATK